MKATSATIGKEKVLIPEYLQYLKNCEPWITGHLY